MNTRSLVWGTLCMVVGITAVIADDWPQWRGPNRDAISKETGLLKEWPKAGPKLLWTCKTAGLGFSGFAVVGDVIYTMGARNEEEYALAFSVKDGSELWATKLGPIFVDSFNSCGDGPRATPTVDGDHVYCLSGQGDLACLKRVSGEAVWRKSMVKDFDGKVMEYTPGRNWGYCESPLIDGEKLICCPGGSGGWMVALDKTSGKQVWRTKELTDQATDSSLVKAKIGGAWQYINSTFKGGDDGGGVAAVDPQTGQVLWYFQIAKWNIYAVCSTPIIKDDLVYVTAGYGAGCNLLQVTKDSAGKFAAKDIYNNKARTLMENTHGGVVLVDGHIYGHCYGRGWVCQELQSGKQAWVDRNSLDGESGSLTYADGNLYLLSDEGEAALLKASPQGWQETSRFSLPERSKTKMTRPTHKGIAVWTHPVVANGRLYLRDQELIFCYAVK